MSTNKNQKTVVRKKLSKRERRLRIVIYIMIIAMLLSSLTAGLAMFV